MPLPPLKPIWTTTDKFYVRLYQGDVLAVLRRLPSASVQCVVTSPPYWGLRDYGTGAWIGGDLNCSHKIDTTSNPSRLDGTSNHAPVAGWTTRDKTVRLNQGHRSAPVHKDGYKSPFRGTAKGGSPYLEQGKMTAGEVPTSRTCPLGCGAVCEDHQLGSESRPDCLGWARGENCAERDWATACHVCRMVLVFSEVRRVLRDDGTLWLNYGDTYGGGKVGRTDLDRISGPVGTRAAPPGSKPTTGGDYRGVGKTDLPSGNLVGVPWRVALALQADGWVLRQDIIWAKPSPMPESVRNRCTKSHEYVFLLTKSMRYFCDMEAIKDTSSESSGWAKQRAKGIDTRQYNNTPEREAVTGQIIDGSQTFGVVGRSNKRSVWTVSAQGYPGAHFATFPPKLIEPMILAGTSAHGACAECGAPWRRVVEERKLTRERPNDYVKRTGAEGTGNKCANSVVEVETVGWEPTCECNGKFEKRKVEKIIRVVEAATSMKNQVRLDEMYHSNKTTLGAYKNSPSHEESSEVTIQRYVSDLPLDEHPIQPCVVLDPFIGSGTTCAVAAVNGRASVGIDLSKEYLQENAIPRVEGAVMSIRSLRGLLPGPKKMVLGDSVGVV